MIASYEYGDIIGSFSGYVYFIKLDLSEQYLFMGGVFGYQISSTNYYVPGLYQLHASDLQYVNSIGGTK